MMNIFMAVIVIMLFSVITSTHAQEIVPADQELVVLRPPPPEEPSEEQTEPAAETPPKKVPPVVQRGQRPYGAIFQMNKRVTCNDTVVVEKYVTEGYEEIPFSLGVVRNRMAIITNIFMMYVNPKSGGFTIVEHASTGISCILAEGSELQFLVDPSTFNPDNQYTEKWPQDDPPK